MDYLDAPGQTAASSVAAGIINPITGRRFVRSWRIEELLPEARALYGELEQELGVQLWYELPLIRTLFNRGEQNDWLARGGDAGYAIYLDDRPELDNLPALTHPAFGYAGVRQAARVDVGLLVRSYRERLEREGRFRSELVDYTALPPGYDRYVFCEGWRARFNPYFDYLPHGGAKGEILLVRTTGPLLASMFKHRVFVVPIRTDTYWVGATNDNTFTDDLPSPAAGDYLRQRLDEVLRDPYEVLAQRAAVRPTVRDRRMLIGQHPQHLPYYIFNGLGTKGASLAPLGSRWLLDLLDRGRAVPAEVDIRRFSY